MSSRRYFNKTKRNHAVVITDILLTNHAWMFFGALSDKPDRAAQQRVNLSAALSQDYRDIQVSVLSVISSFGPVPTGPLSLGNRRRAGRAALNPTASCLQNGRTV